MRPARKESPNDDADPRGAAAADLLHGVPRGAEASQPRDDRELSRYVPVAVAIRPSGDGYRTGDLEGMVSRDRGARRRHGVSQCPSRTVDAVCDPSLAVQGRAGRLDALPQ